MDLQQISSLTRESISKLTSEQYREAFNDQTTGSAFRQRIDEIENSPRPAATSPTRANGRVRADEPSTAPAQTQSFDPSFDDQPTAAPDFPAAAAPVAAQPAAQPAAVVTDFSQLPELEHSYQPMVDGKAAGGRQTFRYRTVNDPNDPNSLVLQLQRAHSYASARIRTLSRDRKLDSIAAAGAAPRTQTEKEVPTTVEGLAVELKAQREQNFALSVRAAVNEFQASVDWAKYRSNENAQSVILAVERANSDPTDPQSYHAAFMQMRGFLEPVVSAAAPIAEVPAPVVIAPATVVAPAVAAPATARRTYGIPTGLSSLDGGEDNTPTAPLGQAAKTGIVVDGVRITSIAQWDKVPSAQQRRILMNPALNAAVESLYSQQAAARGRR